MSLQVKKLRHAYQRTPALCGLDLAVAPGQIVGLLGPNGAGKSTAMGIIAGQLRPDEGSVELAGQCLDGMPTHERARRGLVYLPQAPSVFRDCTVWENMALAVQGLNGTAEQAEAKLDELGISHLRDARAGRLSVGERRRLELARSLIGAPRVLVLDEPFAGVDPLGVEELQRILCRLVQDGLGVLVTDHAVEATLGICDHAIIIDSGTVMKGGCPEEVAADERVRSRYLGHRFELKNMGR